MPDSEKPHVTAIKWNGEKTLSYLLSDGITKSLRIHPAFGEYIQDLVGMQMFLEDYFDRMDKEAKKRARRRKGMKDAEDWMARQLDKMRQSNRLPPSKP